MRDRNGQRHRHSVRQRGQVLVWTLAMAAACVAVFLGVYGVGQANIEKQKIVNTADAAAYSAAMQEARTLNFESYVNRSIVANEVVIAQVVTLDSWVAYMARTAKNIGTILQFIPYANVIGRALVQISDRVLKPLVDNVLPPLVPFHQGLITVLTGAREAAHLATYETAIETAKAVVGRNVTVFGGRTDNAPYITSLGMAALVKNEVSWLNFTKIYAKNDRANAADVIKRSRDRFSGDNERTGGDLTNIDFFFAGISKTSGGTHLVGYDRWEAQDTLDTWHWTIKGRKYDIPVGWGRATASQNGQRGNRWNVPGNANGMAYSSTKAIKGWLGIPEIRDVVDRKATYDPEVDAKAKKAPQTLEFLIEVAKNRTDVPFASSMGMDKSPTGATSGPGSPDLNEKLAGDRIGAVSKAQVFFKRPYLRKDITASSFFRSDNAQEYGSIYNPYWQARLVDVSVTEKEAFYLGSGASGLAIFTPNSSGKN
ncbi:pilus assembly protein TadG-related protein [Ralstonia sp. UBA689]|uniref:pilus assembly protein TadG-related protein n=1 Tax=Ralstonia sp. UBA689 TaxID=1947373 RepID=UPI0025EB1A72|nr:pilus assembly protein TadG-related protein [Ralstonia sp. UBA689]